MDYENEDFKHSGIEDKALYLDFDSSNNRHSRRLRRKAFSFLQTRQTSVVMTMLRKNFTSGAMMVGEQSS